MADVRLGGLFVDLRQRNSQFIRATEQNVKSLRDQQRAINRVRRELRSFNRRVTSTVRGLFNFQSAVAALAGSGALGALARTQAEYGAHLVETSRVTGLAVDQLQLFRRAIAQDGIEADEFADILREFTLRMGEASIGAGEVTESYARYGVAVKDVAGNTRDTFDVIRDLSDALAALPSQADRLVLVDEIFGGEQSVRLLPLLQEGSQALDSQLESFRRFGLVTQDQADRLKDLGESYKDLGSIIQTSLSQAVAESADNLTQFNRTLGDILPGILQGAIEGFVVLIRNLDFVGRAFAALAVSLALPGFQQFIVGLAAMSRNLGIVRTITLSTAAAARFMWRSFILPIAIVEGVIQLVGIFRDVIVSARELGTSLIDVGITAGSGLVTALAEAVLNIPAVLAGVFNGVSVALVQNFLQLGRAMRDAILAPFTGQSVTEAFARNLNFSGVIDQAFSAYQTTVDNLAVDLDPRSLARALGVGEENISTSQMIISNSLSNAWDRVRELFGQTVDSAPLQLPEDVISPIVPVGGAAVSPIQIETENLVNNELERQLQFRQNLIDGQMEEINQLETRTQLLGLEGAERVRLESQLNTQNALNAEALRLTRAEESARRALNRAIEAGTGVQQARIQLDVAQQATEAFRENRAEIEATAMAISQDLSRATEEFEQRSRLADVAREAGDAFGDFTRSAITDFENVGDAVRNLARTIIDSLIESLIVSPIANAASGFLGSLFGGFGGGAFGGNPHRQGGGPVSGGSPYIVGEAGPELFVPSTSGNIVANDAMGGLGPTFNFAPNIAPGVSRAEVDQALAQAFPQFQDAIRSDILSDLSRPSPFSRARSN